MMMPQRRKTINMQNITPRQAVKSILVYKDLKIIGIIWSKRFKDNSIGIIWYAQHESKGSRKYLKGKGCKSKNNCSSETSSQSYRLLCINKSNLGLQYVMMISTNHGPNSYIGYRETLENCKSSKCYEVPWCFSEI